MSRPTTTTRLESSDLRTPAGRLRLLLREAGTRSPNDVDDVPRLLLTPWQLRIRLERHLGEHASRVRVTGTLDRRLVLIERPDHGWLLADLSGRSHVTRSWPGWAVEHIQIQQPHTWLSTASLDEVAVERISRPRTLLAALYHPEYFPLPRFALGIHDVARAARASLLGEVELVDMQLGVTLPDLITQITEQTPDVLGISATFGQHDLLTRVLEAAYTLPTPPLVVVGGSLAARNEALLLEHYPNLLVARGAGEATITDVLAHWHGDLLREQIHGIGYTGSARGTGTLAITRRHTARPTNRAGGEILPELDLLDTTFEHHGVAQAEGSRGCTNTCSFCPRSHKGLWDGAAPETLRGMLTEMRQVFDRYPELARVLYLVDEEFIGRGPDAVQRALAMADMLHEAGFAWETSCRVDQVVRPDRDPPWHIERAAMWRTLRQRGLRRCLFGVESGVDSILERFHKETTATQNALAIRTLSALGIPTRYTYITFDQLMTAEELTATYAFQGRTDLLLRPLPHLSIEQIVAGVRDEQFVTAHATGRPFHHDISYMLVSMECLIGAPYTRQVQAAGLTGDVEPSMGRFAARFADPRIGVCSRWAQLWVDRNFSFDYTLKSLEKILDGQPNRAVRGARVVLKDAAYQVFGHMIHAIADTPNTPAGAQAIEARLRQVLDALIVELVERTAPVVARVGRSLPADRARVLDVEYGRWAARREWRLITAADPCDT
jgi:radical SAM superfamily enzyme YgiQ (UPF0313 family)